ncbi:Na(+)-linked D-alanine glycine permease [Nonlabens ulvanivorans]|nr:Na(+)-linked D-alanine glycine permease [Nonlabens ulvanivorans]
MPALVFSQEAAEKGLDEKIDDAFGWATGDYVQGVFYQIPFTDEIKIYWVLFPTYSRSTIFHILF